MLARTLWDTGCSHNIVSPEFAEELLRRGGRWRECVPLHLSHGNDRHVKAGTPPTRQVCANILLVHKGQIFEQRDVWLYVYDGGLPDVMLSESFLNHIPCISSPGTKLLDTTEQRDDRRILQQCIDDYKELVLTRYTHPQLATSDLHSSSLRAAMHHVEGKGEDDTAVADTSVKEKGDRQRTQSPTQGSSADGEGNPDNPKERIERIKTEMKAQRARLLARLGKPVSPEALQAAQEVLQEYPENFRPPGHDPCNLAIFRIKLKDNSKFHVALPRRTNPIILADMRRQIEELLAAGAIERCHTQPSSVYAVVMAKRPGQPGKYRLCIDLVNLNANTVPMPYAMPDVHEALDRLSGKKYYSSFDFSSWFQQFDIAPEDREKTAFIIPGDNIKPPQIYQWKRMCFGLLNAGYWSQRQLQEALEKFEGCEGIYPFVDDIVIATDTLEEHLQKLEAFMKFCKHHNIRIKREKVELVTGAVKHLGFILSEEGQTLDPARVESLLAIGAPTNLKGLKSLLGSFSFIRGWIAGMADTAAPLTDLMSATAKRMGFQWGPKQELALAALKEACQVAPALGAPDYTKTFHVSMDASDVGVGAVLWQWKANAEGEMMPQAIMYASRRFSDRERRWEISIREMFSIKYALEKFKAYLQGYHDVVIHTDHLNLVTGLYSHASPKIERWRLFIESFRPFKIQHVRGDDRTQLVADGLSRLHIANLALHKTPEEEDEEANLQAELGEGGMDENMFSTHTCTVAHAWASMTDAAGHAEMNSAKIRTEEEQRYLDRYGVGCKLLEGMGWSVSMKTNRRKSPWEEKRQGRTSQHRRGLGFGQCYVSVGEQKDAEPQYELKECTHLGNIHSETDVDQVYQVMNSNEGRQEEGEDPRHAGSVNVAAESQTNAEDFRQAGRRWRGSFPDIDLLKKCHDDTHPSFPITWRRMLRATGMAPGVEQAKLKEQVRHYCDACLTCQKVQPARKRIEARQGTIRQRPFSELAFDVIVLSDQDIEGNRYILVVIDSFSRAIELFPMKRASAEAVTNCLHDVLCRWGRPHRVRCDNAKAFAATVTKQLLQRARVEQHFCAPYSHNSNGQVENANRRVMEILRAMVLDDRLGPQTHLQWSLLLPAVRRVMMSRLVLQHGCCPNDLAYMFCPENEDSIFAAEAWMPDAQEPAEEQACETIANLVRQHQLLIDACEQAQDVHLSALAALQKDEDIEPLVPGDFVLVDMRERPHSKINSPWSGPWLVLDKEDNDATHPIMVLQHIANKKIERFNASMCKRCNLDLFDKVEEAIKYAACDNFEYEIEAILDHEPKGKRQRKAKSTYRFQVLWKGERSEDNPSWEPYSNESLRTSQPFIDYCQRSDVLADLGVDFVIEKDDAGCSKKAKKKQ